MSIVTETPSTEEETPVEETATSEAPSTSTQVGIWKQYNGRFILRNGTLSEWDAANDAILYQGEIGIEFQPDASVKIKVGDGATEWKYLRYFTGIRVYQASSLDEIEVSNLNEGDIAIITEPVAEGSEVTNYTAYANAGESGWIPLSGNNTLRLDGITLTTNDNGALTLVGFDGAANEAIPVKKIDADGSTSVEWRELPAIIATAKVTVGDEISISSTPTDTGYTLSIAGAESATTDQVPFSDGAAGIVWKSVYTKTEVDGLVAGAFHFMGNAGSFVDGILYDTDGNEIEGVEGHVYQVGDKEYAYTVKDGVGTWVELGFNIDLSAYITTEEATDAINTAFTQAVSISKGYTDAHCEDAQLVIDKI